MKTTWVMITVICESNEVDNVILVMLGEGWQKDTNMHQLTMTGKVKFEMWRKMEVSE
ncbi:MAG TPA: hypothetical protein PLG47_04355 [Candidatus Dojkabacteria bacterium]|nr:hypothetical protein [Candidatus Dojkabacteria bacterium]